MAVSSVNALNEGKFFELLRDINNNKNAINGTTFLQDARRSHDDRATIGGTPLMSLKSSEGLQEAVDNIEKNKDENLIKAKSILNDMVSEKFGDSLGEEIIRAVNINLVSNNILPLQSYGLSEGLPSNSPLLTELVRIFNQGGIGGGILDLTTALSVMSSNIDSDEVKDLIRKITSPLVNKFRSMNLRSVSTNKEEETAELVCSTKFITKKQGCVIDINQVGNICMEINALPSRADDNITNSESSGEFLKLFDVHDLQFSFKIKKVGKDEVKYCDFKVLSLTRNESDKLKKKREDLNAQLSNAAMTFKVLPYVKSEDQSSSFPGEEVVGQQVLNANDSCFVADTESIKTDPKVEGSIGVDKLVSLISTICERTVYNAKVPDYEENSNNSKGDVSSMLAILAFLLLLIKSIGHALGMRDKTSDVLDPTKKGKVVVPAQGISTSVVQEGLESSKGSDDKVEVLELVSDGLNDVVLEEGGNSKKMGETPNVEVRDDNKSTRVLRLSDVPSFMTHVTTVPHNNTSAIICC